MENVAILIRMRMIRNQMSKKNSLFFRFATTQAAAHETRYNHLFFAKVTQFTKIYQTAESLTFAPP